MVCRMLGFCSVIEAPGSARFGEGSGRAWLNNVRCFGNETNLADCRHPGFGVQTCSHAEDAGVVCISAGISTLPSSNAPLPYNYFSFLR